MVWQQDGRLGSQQNMLHDDPHSLAGVAVARRLMIAEFPDPQLGMSSGESCHETLVVAFAGHVRPPFLITVLCGFLLACRIFAVTLTAGAPVINDQVPLVPCPLFDLPLMALASTHVSPYPLAFAFLRRRRLYSRR